MDSRIQCELSLDYEKVLNHLCEKYSTLVKNAVPDPVKEANSKNRYKNDRYVLNAFLELYTLSRSQDKDSIRHKTQLVIQTTFSYVTGNKPTQTVLDLLIEGVTEMINAMGSLLAALKLIFKLRQYAEIAQKQKTISGNSLLFLTFHAMACYLVDSCADDLKILIDELKEEKIFYYDQPNKDYADPSFKGRNVSQLNDSYDLVTVALAQLNDFTGVNSAGRMQLLPYYQMPSPSEVDLVSNLGVDVNYGLPIIYQRICMHYVYETSYQNPQERHGESQKITFEEFKIKAAIAGATAAEREDATRKTKAALHNYDLLYISEFSGESTTLPGESPYAYVLTPDGLWFINKTQKKNPEKINNVSQDELLRLMNTYHLHDITNAQDDMTNSPRYVKKLQFADVASLEAKRQVVASTANGSLLADSTRKETISLQSSPTPPLMNRAGTGSGLFQPSIKAEPLPLVVGVTDAVVPLTDSQKLTSSH